MVATFVFIGMPFGGVRSPWSARVGHFGPGSYNTPQGPRRDTPATIDPAFPYMSEQVPQSVLSEHREGDVLVLTADADRRSRMSLGRATPVRTEILPGAAGVKEDADAMSYTRIRYRKYPDIEPADQARSRA
jgi:hypothetical protein